MSYFMELIKSRDVLFEIVSHLEADDLNNLSTICKYVYTVLKSCILNPDIFISNYTKTADVRLTEKTVNISLFIIVKILEQQAVHSITLQARKHHENADTRICRQNH